MEPIVAELGTGGRRGDAEKWRNGDFSSITSPVESAFPARLA
jgi:hypothetical protein